MPTKKKKASRTPASTDIPDTPATPPDPKSVIGYGGRDGHYAREGYRSGVTKKGDRYYIAPGRVTQILEANAIGEAAGQLAKFSQAAVEPMLLRYHTLVANWWTTVLADVGGVPRENWRYDRDEDGQMYLTQEPRVYTCLACGVETSADPARHLEHQVTCEKHPAAMRIRELELKLAGRAGSDPDVVAALKYVVEHPDAGYGRGTTAHLERGEMQRLAELALAKLEERG